MDDLSWLLSGKPPQPTKQSKPPVKDDKDAVASVIDDELSKLGYPSTARLSILGDVGRENNWDRNTIFKGHPDPKNQAYNRGIISWQGDRRAKLDNHLKKEGVLGRNNDDELRGMTRFMDTELKAEYPDVYQTLRNARNTAEASKALRKYIKYVPTAPYNTPDPDFETVNNRQWAERAKSRGLAQAQDFSFLTESLKDTEPQDFSFLIETDKGGQPTSTTVPVNTFLKPDEPLATDAPTQDFSFLAEDVPQPTIPTELKDREALQPVDTTAIDAMMRAPQRGQVQTLVVKVPTRTVQRPTKGKPVQRTTQPERRRDSSLSGITSVPIEDIPTENIDNFLSRQALTDAARRQGLGGDAVDAFLASRGGNILQTGTQPYTAEEIASYKDRGVKKIEVSFDKGLEDDFRRFATDYTEAKTKDANEQLARQELRANIDEKNRGTNKQLSFTDPLTWKMAWDELWKGNWSGTITEEDRQAAIDNAVAEQIKNAGSAGERLRLDEEYKNLSNFDKGTAHVGDIYNTIQRAPASFAKTAAWIEDTTGYLREKGIILPWVTTTDIAQGFDWLASKTLGLQPSDIKQGALPTLFADVVEKIYPDDKRTANTMMGKIARGTGSAVPFLLGAMATGGGSVATGLLGAGMQVGEMYDTAQKEGLSREKQLLSGAIGAPIGFSEAWGLKWAKLGELINKGSKGVFLKSFTEWLKSTGKDATEEALQEFLQSTSSKLTITALKNNGVTLKDVTNAIGDSIEDAAVGGIVGALFGGGVPLAVKAGEKATAPVTKARTDALLKTEPIQQETPKTQPTTDLKGVSVNEKGETTFAGETKTEIEERRRFERTTANITAQQVQNLAEDKGVDIATVTDKPLAEMSADELRVTTRAIEVATTPRKVDPKRASVFDEVFGEEAQAEVPAEKPKKKIKPTVTTEVTEEPALVSGALPTRRDNVEQETAEALSRKEIGNPAFPKSRVTDRVFHGTSLHPLTRDKRTDDFDTFDKRKIGDRTQELSLGFHFTNDPNETPTYSGKISEYNRPLTKISHLNIERPLEIKTSDYNNASDYIDEHLPELKRAIKQGRYDGIIVHAKNNTNYVVFESEQIQSAIGKPTKVTETPVEQPVEKVVDKSTPKAELIAERDEKIAEIEADAKELEATGKVIEARNLRQTITPLRMEYKKKLTSIGKAPESKLTPPQVKATAPNVIEKGQNIITKQPSVDSVNISDLPDGTKVTYTKADGTVVNGTMATDKFGRVVSIGDTTRSVKLPWKPVDAMFKRPVEGSPEFNKATELANLPKRGETFLKGVESTAKEGFIDLSPEAVEMGRVIDKAVGRNSSIRFGSTYTKSDAIDHIEGAKDLRQVLKDKGMSIKTIDKYIADFEKVAKENQGIVPVGIEASRKHETLHGADLKSRIVNGETITTTKESDAVAKNPTFKKFHDKLNEIVGKNLSTESAMAEAVAYLGDGDYKQFGLTIKEAASVLADIGIARFNSLVEAYDGDVEKAIENMSHFNIEGGEKIYEAIKSTDNGKGVRPSTESGQKREGKSETVGSKDAGNAETTGQGKATTEESDGVGFKPSGEVKQSQTPETLRGNLDLPVKDIDYTSTSNPERKALADSILSEGVDKAKAWVEDQINRKQNNAGATATVGIGVINELGGQGRIDEMNALSEKLLPTITDAAQTVQAVSTASMWNPESAAAYAEMAKMRKFGKGLTAKETAEALELAKAMHNNIVQAATNNTQLAELEARMARLIDENVEYKEMLEVAEGRAELAESDLKAANKQIKALEKEKGDTTVRVPRDTRKRINEIRKVLPQIEKRLNDKYGKINEAMLMAVGPTVDQDLVDWTLINLSKNLTSKSATEIKTEISQRANGQLSANMVDEIHARAMAEMESERTPLTPAQLKAKSILNAEHRNRLSHYSAARKHRLNTMRINLKDLIAGNKPKDFKQKFVDYIVDAGKKYSPEATYVALARTKLKNGQQLTDPNDVIVRLKELEYPDMTHDEVFKALADSQRILNDAKANRQADNIIAKYNENLTAEQIDYIRQDQANVLIARRNIQKKGLGFYESLLKTPGQIKIETLVNFRRANLLTGLKTHGVNIVGNASYQTFDEVVRPLSKVTDFITSKFTNETTIQGMSKGAIFKSFKSLVKDDGLLVKSGKVTGLQAMKDIWANGGTMEDMQRLQHAESILHRAYDKETKPKRFKTAKAIDYYINKVYRSLGAEDAAFKVYAFTRAMQESAYTQAVTEQKKRGETKKWRQDRQKELIEHPSHVAIQQADDFAQYMTFQNDNAISTLFQHIKNTHYSVRAAAEIVVPFDRTPTNLIFRTLEIFPVTGLVASGYKLGRIKYGKGKKFSLQSMKFVPDADFNSRYSDAIRQDNKTELAKMSQADAAKFIAEQLGRQYTRKAQADFARTVGRMAPGNALFALGALLAAGGFLTGAMWGGDDDKAERDESMERMSKGIENRSLYVPHVGRFVLPKSPPFDAMVAGATMYEQTMMGKKDPVLNAMNGATETLTDVIWEQPLLNSTTELMTKIDKHKYGEKIGQIGSGFVPASGFQREVSEVFDPVRRSGSGYTGNQKEDDTIKGTLLQQARGFKNSLLKGVPGVRNVAVDKSPLEQPKREWWLTAARWAPGFGIFKPEAAKPYDQYVNQDWVRIRKKLLEEK